MVANKRKKSAPITAPTLVANCMFREPVGPNSWKWGSYRARREDGTVELIDCKNGNSRAIQPDHVRTKGRGPRGGLVDVFANQVEWPMDDFNEA